MPAGAMTEQEHQAALFDAIRLHTAIWPELALAFHVPNEGKHTVAYRVKQARQGVKAGCPDVWLPFPRRGYNGLCIELKVKPNTLSAAQHEWQRHLTVEGWCAVLRWDWESAWETIRWYLGSRTA